MIAIALDEEEEENRRKKRKWVHEAWKLRESEGEFVRLYKELIKDERKYFEYFKMSESCFNILLQKLRKKLVKKFFDAAASVIRDKISSSPITSVMAGAGTDTDSTETTLTLTSVNTSIENV
ncbi:unnamed protein product [Leptidea sinapis]|uniref:Uncharacterized protein n=1 Tax=Leptidea sinapis TaxID=189913 RepID=A0A5E4QDV9_9NEOP|nr:unnamed protein product [Leptidea sinapis]